MLPLVFLACFYNVACNDTANAFYLSDPEAQQTVKYSEQRVKQYLNEKQILFGAAALGAATGNDFVVALTSNATVKGNVKWHQLSFSYSWPL